MPGSQGGASPRAMREILRSEKLEIRGKLSEAIHSIELALLHGGDRYTCFMRLAHLYHSENQLEKAVNAAEKAVEIEPARVSAHEAVIALYLEAHEYARAVDASRALLKISPRHLPARDALGTAYFGLGDIEAAMRVANDLVRLNPDNPYHHYTRALLCQHVGEVGMAVEELQRVMEIAPELDIAESAANQLITLDNFQVETIVTLAVEDGVFRAHMARDPVQAIIDRGFHLSEMGQAHLLELCALGLTENEGWSSPGTYH